MRALIAVTHLLGAGHLARAAAIARAIVRAGDEVTLVTGGADAPLVDVGGVPVVQLPPVKAGPGGFTDLRDEHGAPVGADRLRQRGELLVRAFAAARPDVVVTETYPFGRRVLAGEYEALIGAARAREPRAMVAASVRDILVAPSRPAKLDAAHARLREAYDAVLVHGEEGIVRLDASWPVPADLRERLFYTGYIDAADDFQDLSPGLEGDTVLVSGGSSAAAVPLYRAALEAARLGPGRRWRILLGHGVPADAADALAGTAPPNARVERARRDFRACLAEAAVFVGQAGYNTVMDILATQARAVLVPYEAGRETEQRLRADELARRGYADVLPESELDGATLLTRVEGAAARPRPGRLNLVRGGADRTAAILSRLAGGAAP